MAWATLWSVLRWALGGFLSIWFYYVCQIMFLSPNRVIYPVMRCLGRTSCKKKTSLNYYTSPNAKRFSLGTGRRINLAFGACIFQKSLPKQLFLFRLNCWWFSANCRLMLKYFFFFVVREPFGLFVPVIFKMNRRWLCGNDLGRHEQTFLFLNKKKLNAGVRCLCRFLYLFSIFCK